MKERGIKDRSAQEMHDCRRYSNTRGRWGGERRPTVIDYMPYLLNDKPAKSQLRGTPNLLSLVLEQDIVCFGRGGEYHVRNTNY